MKETIEVCAGEGDAVESFTVHTTYATKSSKFIQAALGRDSWKEAQEKRITLPEAEPAVFESYIHWLYTNDIDLGESVQVCDSCQRDALEPDGEGERLCMNRCSQELASMYILGDFLDDTRFCNAVMDVWKKTSRRVRCVPQPSAVEIIWEQTSVGCPARELLLQHWKGGVSNTGTSKYLLDHAEHSKEFLVDLLMFIGDRHRTAIARTLFNNAGCWSKNAFCTGTMVTRTSVSDEYDSGPSSFITPTKRNLLETGRWKSELLGRFGLIQLVLHQLQKQRR